MIRHHTFYIIPHCPIVARWLSDVDFVDCRIVVFATIVCHMCNCTPHGNPVTQAEFRLRFNDIDSTPNKINLLSRKLIGQIDGLKPHMFLRECWDWLSMCACVEFFSDGNMVSTDCAVSFHAQSKQELLMAGLAWRETLSISENCQRTRYFSMSMRMRMLEQYPRGLLKRMIFKTIVRGDLSKSKWVSLRSHTDGVVYS
jgi:hypothetical protein